MSKPKTGTGDQLALLKNAETRERWRWVHEAIGHAKEATKAAMLEADPPPRDDRPMLRRVR